MKVGRSCSGKNARRATGIQLLQAVGVLQACSVSGSWMRANRAGAQEGVNGGP